MIKDLVVFSTSRIPSILDRSAAVQLAREALRTGDRVAILPLCDLRGITFLGCIYLYPLEVFIHSRSVTCNDLVSANKVQRVLQSNTPDRRRICFNVLVLFFMFYRKNWA